MCGARYDTSQTLTVRTVALLVMFSVVPGGGGGMQATPAAAPISPPAVTACDSRQTT